MIAPERIAAIVLAAGASTRFGDDKLMHPLAGKAMAAHVADTLSGMPFAYRFAIVATGTPRRAELFSNRRFDIVTNPEPGQGLSSSLAIGASLAAALGVDALLVCLADMPFVTRSHLSLLIGAAGVEPVATACAGLRTPPAIFPSSMFADLMALTGDRGAKPLLEGAMTVEADAALVRDIDTMADLA